MSAINPPPNSISGTPLASAWGRLKQCWAGRKQTGFFNAWGMIISAAWLTFWHASLLGLRAVTALLLQGAPVILGGIAGYFCYHHASDAIGLSLKGLFPLNVNEANDARRTLLGLGAVMAFLPVLFLLWKRRTDFLNSFRVNREWIWWGDLNRTEGLIRSLTKQISVFAGLFFSLFSLMDEPRQRATLNARREVFDFAARVAEQEARLSDAEPWLTGWFDAKQKADLKEEPPPGLLGAYQRLGTYCWDGIKELRNAPRVLAGVLTGQKKKKETTTTDPPIVPLEPPRGKDQWLALAERIFQAKPTELPACRDAALARLFALTFELRERGTEKPPEVTSTTEPSVSQPSTDLSPLLREIADEIKAVIDARNDFVVYLDKSTAVSNMAADREKHDLIYVAHFENASLNGGARKGRELDPPETRRLEKFAAALSHIATFSGTSGTVSATESKLKIVVRGFASDAPKMGSPARDPENVALANDRARHVHTFLKARLAGASVDLQPAIVWKDSAEMKQSRQYEDMHLQLKTRQASADAEAPNRRVEILVTLPAGLRAYVPTNSLPPTAAQ